MEKLDTKKIYFIYSQIGKKSNIQAINAQKIVKKVKKIEEKISENNLYILYCLELFNDFKEKPFTLILIDNNTNIYSTNIYPKSPGKFKYDILFDLDKYNQNQTYSLDQIIKPYKEQFNIFKNYLKDDEKALNDLFLDSINYLSEKNPDSDYNFIMSVFVAIYQLFKYNPNIFTKTIKKYFEELNLELLEKYGKNNKNSEEIVKPKLDINQDDLDIFSNIHNIRKELIKITEDKEEINNKIDAFLGFYYIYFKPKLFINFVDKKNNKFNEIKLHLILHKKIFNEFNSNIILLVMEETENLEQIESIISNFVPNIVEFFKMLANILFFTKLGYLRQIENKKINIINLIKPHKEDNITELDQYFSQFMELFLQERILPISLNKDLFLEYCELFKNESYEKIGLIYNMLNTFNKKVNQKYKIKIDREIEKYYHDTGIYLIANKKIKNNDVINFLKKDYYYYKNNNNEIPIDKIIKGIDFFEGNNEDNKSFINDFFNNKIDEIDFREYFDEYYFDFMKKIFNVFAKPKDLVSIVGWNIDKDVHDEVLENFLNTIKRVWLSDPNNHMYSLEKLIGSAFGLASLKLDNYLTIINQIEKKIKSDLLLPIYSELLFREYEIASNFKEHVIDYINKNIKNNAISIWYKVTTLLDDEGLKFEFLEEHLEEKYAVEVNDLVTYPTPISEKISLFTKLDKAKIFRNKSLKKMPYYKKSIESKDNIYKIKYTDAMKMYKNINHYLGLFTFFIPSESLQEKEIFAESILICFSDKCGEAKKNYESLENTHKFWNKFFYNEKIEEIIKLQELIKKYQNTPLNDCEQLITDNKSFLKDIKEINEGIQLMESIFFMEIYNSNKDKYKNEKDRYKNSFEQFKQLKILEIKSDVNSLEKELKNNLITSIYKNKDRLNNELNFIKSFFNISSNNNNYNITKIKNNLLRLVNQYIKENNLKENKIIEVDIVKDTDNENVKDNVNVNDKNNKKIEEEENKILITDIHELKNKYYLESIIYEDTPNINNELIQNNIIDCFCNYFKKIFEINLKFIKIDINELNHEVIPLTERIFINGLGLGLMNLKKNKEFLLLITEYNDIFIEIFKHQKESININVLLLLLKYINDLNEYKDNKPEELQFLIGNLLSIVKDNIKNDKRNYLLNKLLIKEKRKRNVSIYLIRSFNKLIFKKEKNDFYFIYNNKLPIPYIDEIFYDELNLKFDNNNVKGNENEIKKKLESSNFNEINDICGEKDIFEEMILSYFEGKIMMLFDNKFNKDNNNELELFRNSQVKKYLFECINLLQNLQENNKNNNKTIIKLYCIAFIKCFYNKFIFYLKNDMRVKNSVDIEELITKAMNSFNKKELRTSIELYILKLLFDNYGSFSEFKKFNLIQHKFEFVQNDAFFKENIKILDLKSNFGFDYIFFPIKQEGDSVYQINQKDDNDFVNLLKYLINIKINNEENTDLIHNINNNNNIDFLYCGLINIHFSNYNNLSYISDNKNEYNNMNKWIEEKISKNEIDILKENDILSKILLLFTKEKDYKEKISSITLSYDELLCLLISVRYVLNTISFGNTEGLFYKLVVEPQSVIDNNKNYFKHYLKDFDSFRKEKSEINYLTYKIINYVILSHVYFGVLLGNVKNIDDILENLNIYDKYKNLRPESQNLLTLLFNEFMFIKNDLLNLIGINKIIIFMNYIFEHVSSKIINLKCINDDKDIKEIEKEMDNTLFDLVIPIFNLCIDDYYEKLEELSEAENEDYKNQNIFKDIFFENDKFYNNKDSTKDYTFISYLTSTNFSTFDDFKKQYLYFEFPEKKDYPVIDCILNNNNLIEIIELIPRINSFINNIYSKLMLRISEDDLDKRINDIDLLPELDIDSFNNTLQGIINKLSDLQSIEINLKEITKISDIINIKDNTIYKIYNSIIKEYNEFLSKIKIYIENKDIIDNIIIQNASENDYITFKTAKERLSEIIILYSSRNRIQDDNKINVYDGGKINYDYNIIENILEEEFIFGKKKFSEVQKTFIFSNNVFSDERKDILIELNKKYEQNEIGDKNKIDEYFGTDNNNSKEVLLDFYYNLQYIIIYLMTYEKENNYISSKTKIDYIIKIIKKGNYSMNEHFTNFINSFSFVINNILHLYEIVELKSFDYLTEEINQKISEINNEMNTNQEIDNNFLSNNSLLNNDELINGIKKYILRYCLGDNKNIDNIISKMDNMFNDIFNKTDIWGKTIYNDKRFKEESNKLISINKENNCIIKYYYNTIFQRIQIDLHDDGYNPNPVDDPGVDDVFD